MSSQSGLSHVYVGAARWVGATLGGLFRQTVGQDGWELLRKGLPEPTEVQAITVHPENPDVVFVGTQDGPYRTTNRGESWERLAFPDEGRQVWSILVHPRDRRVLYAGTSPVGIYRSEDGGDTWRRLPVTHTERVTMPFACRVMRLAVDPGPPDAVYAGLEVAGAMCSLDGGETWQDCSDHLVKLAEQQHLKNCILTDNEAEGMLDAHAVCVSAAAPGSAFLAVRTGLFRSDDRGATWTDLEVGRFSPLTYGRDIRVCFQEAGPRPAQVLAEEDSSRVGHPCPVAGVADRGLRLVRHHVDAVGTGQGGHVGEAGEAAGLHDVRLHDVLGWARTGGTPDGPSCELRGGGTLGSAPPRRAPDAQPQAIA